LLAHPTFPVKEVLARKQVKLHDFTLQILEANPQHLYWFKP